MNGKATLYIHINQKMMSWAVKQGVFYEKYLGINLHDILQDNKQNHVWETNYDIYSSEHYKRNLNVISSYQVSYLNAIILLKTKFMSTLLKDRRTLPHHEIRPHLW